MGLRMHLPTKPLQIQERHEVEAGQRTEHKLLKLNIECLSFRPLPKIGRGQCTEELWVSLLKHGINPVHFTRDLRKWQRHKLCSLWTKKSTNKEKIKALGPSASYEKEAAEIHQQQQLLLIKWEAVLEKAQRALGGAEVQGKWAQQSLSSVELDPIQGTSLPTRRRGWIWTHVLLFSVSIHNRGCYVFPILTFKVKFYFMSFILLKSHRYRLLIYCQSHYP